MYRQAQLKTGTQLFNLCHAKCSPPDIVTHEIPPHSPCRLGLMGAVVHPSLGGYPRSSTSMKSSKKSKIALFDWILKSDTEDCATDLSFFVLKHVATTQLGIPPRSVYKYEDGDSELVNRYYNENKEKR